MFLFGTLRRPTYESDFVKQSTWKLYGTLQGATQYRPHFEGQIVGLNAAWSLTQGFVNKGSDGEFVSRAPRMLLDPGDPLGSYLCSSCYFYRRNYGKLPDEAFAKLHRAKRYYQRWIENEREHKRDIFCKGCNKVEAPGASRHTRFVMSHSDPSQFYCKQCWKSSRYESKYKAQEAVCRNPYCGARPGNRTLTGRTVPRLVKGLCLPCGLYMKDNAKKAKESNNADKADDANEAADDFFIERVSSRTKLQIQFDILSGRAVHHCSRCKTEVEQYWTAKPELLLRGTVTARGLLFTLFYFYLSFQT
ncbi:hypothetical protein EN45_065620 [Penicillium chrysogenum]|uniref:Uncharacterized protein n=1 Tax=Penicillium chrysogenum TaxID=5076 RepID=A0A167T8C2_PENCH|nr:hypothetical protein EN45_065620 [Penicillium chrysogenum]